MGPLLGGNAGAGRLEWEVAGTEGGAACQGRPQIGRTADRFPTQFHSHWPHLAAPLAVSSDPRRRPRTPRLRNPSPRVLGVGWRPGPLDFPNQTSLPRPDVQRRGRARVNPAGVGTLERSAERGREGAGRRRLEAWGAGRGRASEEAAGTSRQPLPHTPRAARGHRRPPAPNFKSRSRGETLGIKTGGSLSGRCPLPRRPPPPPRLC